MKQTAVEWLVNKLNNNFENNDFLISYANEISKAKEMEKQQIEVAYEVAYMDGYNDNGKDGRQYYNETFKNK